MSTIEQNSLKQRNLKQRSFTRYEIKLVATLVVNNTHFIQCMIRDFCSRGLFLQPLTDNGFESLKPLQTKRIIFSVNLKQGGNDFSLDAKIMHIRSHGFGVEFESNSEVAFKALKKEAQDTLGLKPADRRNKNVTLSKQKALETDLSYLLKKILPAIISSFYQRINAIPSQTNGKFKNSEDMATLQNGVSDLKKNKITLLNAIPPETREKFKKPEDMATLQNGVSNLKKNKITLLEDFCSTVQETSHLSMELSERYHESNTKTSLSLVKNNDFEDWLNIVAVIQNLESLYETQLDQLQKKIAYINNVNKNRAVNPASPGRLCDCFRNIINTFEDNILIKSMLYDLFEKTLREFLPDLYEKMDSILTELGAPINTDNSINWTKVNPVAQQSGTYLKQTIGPNPPHPLITELATETSAENTSDLLHLLQQQNSSSQSVATTSDRTPEYSAEEISLAFTDLHQKTVHSKNLHHTSAQLRTEILQTLEYTSSSQKQLSSTDENSLEAYGCLFEILFNKLLSEQKIKSYLHRIYIPIINYAMLNPAFLETSNNPARSILNHLFWLELALANNELVTSTQTRESLDFQLEQLSKYSLNHSSTFAIVENKLHELTDSIKKSIKNNILRVTKIYEGKQKLIKAQQSVEEEFNRRHLSDKNLPRIICTLLDAGWEHLLVLAKLNEDNNAFQSHLRIIINLNGWLSGSEKVSKDQAETTLKFIDTQLQSVCTNAFLHDKILVELNLLLLGNGLQSNSDAIKMVPLKKYKSIQSSRNSQDHNRKLDHLKVGDWLTFLLEKKREQLQLVWVNETQDLFVFVTRCGIKRLELNQEDLIALINKGKTHKIESLDIPIMDRATDLMLHEMHNKLVCNATHDPVTHLLNRNLFIKQLKRELTRIDNAQQLLCNIEIQDFKVITDDCGLAGEDALLKQLANSLKVYLREGEIITQLDSNTFTILYQHCPVEDANKVARKLQSRLINSPFIWMNKSYSIAVSIGIVPLSSSKKYDIDSLMQKINSVTLSAANAGYNSILIYKDDVKAPNPLKVWESKINQIFTEFSFFPRCQKIAAINPEKNSHSYYKILLGIKDENSNLINPDEFFWSLLEIDHWLILRVFSWIEQNQSVFETLQGFSIRLSSESINSKEFLDFLSNTLSSSNIPLSKITFEIPETIATDNFIFVQQFIKRIKHFNCKFALSDFGENYYSSHTFLKSLDIDYLIISKVLIKSLHYNTFDIAIVKSLVTIAQSLGLETIAETVENSKTQTILRDIGINYCLGSDIQKPILLTDLE